LSWASMHFFSLFKHWKTVAAVPLLVYCIVYNTVGNVTAACENLL